MSLGKKLALLRRLNSLTQEQVAEQIGISRARYSHYETDRSEPDLHTLKDLADYFQVSVDYLLDSISSSRTELVEPLDSSDTDIVFDSPVLGITKPGKAIYAGDYMDKDKLVYLFEKGCFYIRAKEDSIKLMVKKGDLILVDQHFPIQNGVIVAVYYKKEEIIKLRHIYRLNKTTILLPTNPISEPVQFKSQNIKILGKALLRLGYINQ